MADESKESGKSWRPKLPSKRQVLRLLLIAGAILFAFRTTIFGGETHELTRANLIAKAQRGQVVKVVYEDDTHLTAKLRGSSAEWQVTYPKPMAADTFRSLEAAHVVVEPKDHGKPPWGGILKVMFIVMIGSMVIDLGGSAASKLIAKAKGQEINSIQSDVTLDDIKGMSEVVAEARDIANALRHPDKYAKVGARLPAGVVFHGPPGTGKTMLAKAIANEAGVPFYSVTPAAVRSMWVGKAGQAILKTFKKARKSGPVSIIFFDEGDTLGGRRNQSSGGAGEEHDAMVNEILAQISKNEPGAWVFVIIATNHPDELDEALVRSGRCDLMLAVTQPDFDGRLAILQANTKGKPLCDDVDLEELAKATFGKVGADLEALANNAALRAGNRGSDEITHADFQHALTVMQVGPASSRKVSEKDRRITAYHEAGHAIVAAVSDGLPNPDGITILAHGDSGGHTTVTPDEDVSQYLSRTVAKQRLAMLMAGLAGEKLALNADFTNGPASDRQRATELATMMVCYWGMGTYNVVLGSDWQNGPHAYEALRQIEDLLDEAELEAIALLLKYKPEFDALAQRLLLKETLRAADLQEYNPQPVDDEDRKRLENQYKHVIDSVECRVLDRKAVKGNGHLVGANT